MKINGFLLILWFGAIAVCFALGYHPDKGVTSWPHLVAGVIGLVSFVRWLVRTTRRSAR